MPYEAHFELDNFTVVRADETRGDEPYLFAAYWALDDGIRINPDGTLSGAPRFLFKGGRHGNVSGTSLTPRTTPVPIRGDVATGDIEASDVNWQAQVRAAPSLAAFAAGVPVHPTVGCTIAVIEEDNTRDRVVRRIFDEVEREVPVLAQRFITGLSPVAIATPAGMNTALVQFQNQITNDIRSIAIRIGAARFNWIDPDDFIATRTFSLPAGPRVETDSQTLNFARPAAGPGLSGGGFSGRAAGRYSLDVSGTVRRTSDDPRRILLDIDFDGRDDERRRDEIFDPPPTTFELQPGRMVSRQFRWGGELRAEYDFLARTVAGDRTRIVIDGRLFEGRRESTNDLDGTGSLLLDLSDGGTANGVLQVTNTDENEPDDFGRIRVTARSV